MKKIKFKKYWYILFPVLFLILIELLEFIIDYIFGNKDGKLVQYNIGNYITKLQLFVFILSFIIYSFKSKKAVLINLSIFIIFWIILEIGLSFGVKKRSPNVSQFGTYKTNYFLKDPILGYKPRSSSMVNSMKIVNSDTIYNVSYTTDNYSRRIDSLNKLNSDNKKYAIFFGGSITFGEGVNDKENFVSLFNQNNPDYTTYNYGFCGYGTNQMIANLSRHDFRNEIKHDSGICVYAFIDHHIQRNIGSMSVVSVWADKTPYYSYDKNGDIVRKGTFKKNRKFTTMIYKIIASSNFSKFFNIDIPGKLKDKHYNLTADIINESKKIYSSKFSNDNFYVVIFPGSPNNILPYLKERNINIIDLSDLYEETENRLSKFDLHPNAKGHEIFIKELKKILINKNL